MNKYASFLNFGANSLDCGLILDNLEKDTYVCTTLLNYTVLPGQFVRPRPNKFQTNFNNQNYYQSSTTNHNQSVNQAASPTSRPTPTHSATHEIIPDQEISYPTTTTTENQYKTDFGYKVVPKPTEAVKIIPAPVTEPVRPFIPIFESYSRFVIF